MNNYCSITDNPKNTYLKKFYAFGVIFILSLLLISNSVFSAERTVEFKSYKELLSLFEQLNYTEKRWDAGLREVPRVYLGRMPTRWRNKHSKEVQTKIKKEVFFRVLAPLILRSNELIMKDREQLLKVANNDDLRMQNQSWLQELAIKYKVIKSSASDLTSEQMTELKSRVDIVPPSIAMAQTAEESGWGTSRFADLGNAMFGQWTWGDKGITPEQQRKGKGNYKIAAFKTPLDSVMGYMMNLNTHNSYKLLRKKRAMLRSSNKPVTGLALTETLVNYSERGRDYVKSLNSLISYNKLSEIDEAHLIDKETIILVPVGDGAE